MSDKQNKKIKYQLDSSAAFYPYFAGKKSQSMFCICATMKQDVDKELMRVAVNDAAARFPLYKTRLKKGFWAYYLEENDAPIKVFDIDGRVLVPIDARVTNGYRFRLSVGGRRVLLEMFHALTDANGAIKFLSAILRRYAELKGVQFDGDCVVSRFDERVPDGELEDSFKKHYKHIPFSALNLKGMAGSAPHRTQGTLLNGAYELAGATCAAADVVKNAKAMGVSVTGYLTGAAAYAIAKSASVKRPIVIMVPVNLRKIFPSVTASNFVTFVRIIVRKEECKTFEDCVRICSAQLVEKAKKEEMEAFVSTTVRAQKSMIFRCVPLFLKWLLIRLGRLCMKSRQTLIFSNVGNIELPDGLDVEGLSLYINVSKNNVQNLGAITYGGVCRLVFTSAIKERALPEAMFDALNGQGIETAKTDV